MLIELIIPKHAGASLESKAFLKKSGTAAEDRSIAALAALRYTRPANFCGIGGLWPACLLQRERLFWKKSDSTFWLSYGFEKYTALGRKLQEVEQGDPSKQFFTCAPELQPSEAPNNLQKMFNSGVSRGEDDMDEELFEGVPFTACHSTEFALFCLLVSRVTHSMFVRLCRVFPFHSELTRRSAK